MTYAKLHTHLTTIKQIAGESFNSENLAESYIAEALSDMLKDTGLTIADHSGLSTEVFD